MDKILTPKNCTLVLKNELKYSGSSNELLYHLGALNNMEANYYNFLVMISRPPVASIQHKTLKSASLLRPGQTD